MLHSKLCSDFFFMVSYKILLEGGLILYSLPSKNKPTVSVLLEARKKIFWF